MVKLTKSVFEHILDVARGSTNQIDRESDIVRQSCDVSKMARDPRARRISYHLISGGN